jgi:hypothetical protein
LAQEFGKVVANGLLAGSLPQLRLLLAYFIQTLFQT